MILQLFDFNLNEAKYIIKSFLSDLFLEISSLYSPRFKTVIIFSLVFSLTLVFILKFFNFINRNRKINYLRTLNIFLIIPFVIFWMKSYDHFYTNALDEFNYKVRSIIKNENLNIVSQSKNEKLKIITFISESIAAMNMSLYGYPFNTTPNLKNLSNSKNFILFNDMYAVHTLTSHTLFAALNVCIICSKKKNDNFIKVAPIVNLLKQADIETAILSNQPDDGYSNLVEKILFKNNMYFKKNKFNLKEKNFFHQEFCENKDLTNYRNIILHSYVGHFDYNHQVPNQYHQYFYPPDINEINFLGDNHQTSKNRYLETLSHYDLTLVYLDDIVNSVINCSESHFAKNSEPIVFIYFSDHGESPMTNAGHDPAKITFEMIKIPFFIYFNDVAINMYPKLFNYIKNLSNKRLTQKVFSDLILKIFQINFRYQDTVQNINYDIDNSIKNNSYYEFILRRNLINGKTINTKTYWDENLNLNKILNDDFWYQDTDHLRNEKWNDFFSDTTSISNWQFFNLLNYKRNYLQTKYVEPLICQHRSNTLARQIRGIFTTGCVEIDVHFYNDKAFAQYDKNLEPLNIEYIFNSEYEEKNFWLDAKNVNSPLSCKIAYNWLSKNLNLNVNSILFEIPSDAYFLIDNDEYVNCIKNIDNLPKVEVAYYTPTEDGMCDPFVFNACSLYYEKINKVIENFSINSITFDYFRNYGAISNNINFKDLRFHIWHISNPMKIFDISKKFNLGFVIPNNNKKTYNLD